MGSLSRASADCTLNPATMKDWERLIPAANMGEYEPPRERPEDGGLYPLNAEGTYGRVPKNRNPGRWQELPKYQKREKKPKLYASYAISDKCELHSLVLDKYMRPPKCSVHSSGSGSGRSSRATSAPPQNLPVTEVKEKSVEKSSRQASLPPVEVGSTMMLKVEDLDMLARLKLAREKEEDCMESLVDLGEADHDQEDGAYDEDEASEVSSRSVSRQSVVEGGKLTTSSEETTSLKMEKKKETHMESTGLVLQEDNMTTYVV